MFFFVDGGFFLVQMIDETRANDTSTMSDGLNLDGWFALPEKCSLVKNKC